METRVIEVDPLEDCRSVYKEASTVLAEGGLVAIPTETVYGLGADALNTEAVANVFAVKARPSFDPLICHFARAKDIADYTEVPAELQPLVDKLAKEFWPGPMTLVLPRKPIIPDIVKICPECQLRRLTKAMPVQIHAGLQITVQSIVACLIQRYVKVLTLHP